MRRPRISVLRSLLFPAPVPDPEPYTRLDRLDGLPGRGDAQWPDRYDAEWPDVLAAEAPGGDLAAMAAPADWPAFTDWGTYDIEPEPVGVSITADVREFTAAMERIRAAVEALGAPPILPMVRAAATAYDLGLPVPLRSDPPIYRACLAGHVGVGA